jgi:hypothetical protein
MNKFNLQPWVFGGLLLAAQAASAQLAVITSTSAPALSKDQVTNAYLGRSADLKPVDLPLASPLRAQFYLKATDRDLNQIKATWSRIVFTGKGQPPKEMADAAAVKKAVAADPRAIGYIDKGSLDASVKAVVMLE